MSDEGFVHLEVERMVATITFDRPRSRNAMTWKMYEQLSAHLTFIHSSDGVRVVILRGSGGEAFIAGTDIRQFENFTNGQDGIAYNQRIGEIFSLLETIRVPTIAVLRGFAIGGGLAIASCCDMRLASRDAKLGLPVARTLGNLPAMDTIARLVALIGPARTKEMVFLAELWDAERALAAGLVTETHPPEELDARVENLCDLLVTRAPLTMAGVKESVRRMVEASIPEGQDLIRAVYGSADFREGVSAFVEKRRPDWKNR